MTNKGCEGPQHVTVDTSWQQTSAVASDPPWFIRWFIPPTPTSQSQKRYGTHCLSWSHWLSHHLIHLSLLKHFAILKLRPDNMREAPRAREHINWQLTPMQSYWHPIMHIPSDAQCRARQLGEGWRSFSWVLWKPSLKISSHFKNKT